MRGHKPPSITIGTYGHWWWPERLRLSPADARRHVHVQGKSGYGKSRFLAHWFLTMLECGYSATVIDPQGDLARLILCHLIARGVYRDEQNFTRIRYLDFAAAERASLYLPLNVLQQPGSPYTVAVNVKDAFHRAWPELRHGASNFNTLVRDSVKVLVSNGLSLAQLHEFLTETSYRHQLLAQETDPEIVKTFTSWYDRFTLREQADIAGSTIRRARELTFSPLLRHSLGASELGMNFRQLLDDNVSSIIKLDLRNVDERTLLECLLTVAAEQGALSRSELPPGKRFGTHFLILDEFAEMVSQSEDALTSMLSGTRKFGLFCVLAHQTWSQASERLKGGLQNVDVEIAFQLGRADAEHSARILGSVDPKTVRQNNNDEHTAESAGMAEQWETWVQRLMQLPKSHAMVRTPDGSVREVKTAFVPDPVVDPAVLETVEQRYLQSAFRPQPRGVVVEAAIQGSGPSVPHRRRSVRIVEDDGA